MSENKDKHNQKDISNPKLELELLEVKSLFQGIIDKFNKELSSKWTIDVFEQEDFKLMTRRVEWCKSQIEQWIKSWKLTKDFITWAKTADIASIEKKLLEDSGAEDTVSAYQIGQQIWNWRLY